MSESQSREPGFESTLIPFRSLDGGGNVSECSLPREVELVSE